MKIRHVAAAFAVATLALASAACGKDGTPTPNVPPGSSGTISTVSICAGEIEITSVRRPACSTTFPCQCGVWKLNPSPNVTRYQRTRSPFFIVITGMLAYM